jgi:hypothetical protein
MLLSTAGLELQASLKKQPLIELGGHMQQEVLYQHLLHLWAVAMFDVHE